MTDPGSWMNRLNASYHPRRGDYNNHRPNRQTELDANPLHEGASFEIRLFGRDGTIHYVACARAQTT